MATFDFLNLGGSVSPPPTVPGRPEAPSRPSRQRTQSSDEDEEAYQQELRHKRTGLRKKKKPIASSSEADDGHETTRAEDRDDGDDEQQYAAVSFKAVSLGDEEAQEAAPMANKQSWVEEQLQLREDEFTTEKTVRVFCGSWNVNAKTRQHDGADITAWLLPPDEDDDDRNVNSRDMTAGAEDEKERVCTPADVYAIGFQEIVDLNAKSLIADHSAAAPWEQFILATLHKTGRQFVQIASVHLVGLSLSVFVRDRYQSAISDVRVGTVGTGIMGVGGNKGAVLVRFELFKSSLCIINAHLAAHQKKVSARNKDYAKILRRALLLPQPGQPRRKKLYTDTSNKLKLQPWVEDAVVDEDEEDDEEEEAEEATTVNAAAANTATAAGAAKAAAAEKREVIVVGGKEINVGGMKKLMAAGLSSLRKGIATTIQTVSAEIEQMQGPTEEMLRDGYRVHEADHIIWIGDLNYRLNVNSMQEVHELIDAGRFRKLLTKVK